MAAKKQNPCSLVVVNEKNGNVLHGTAAILHATSRAGGFDQYMADYGTEILRGTFETHMQEQRRPRLRRAS
ncbi:hypothetical protein [Paraburkholderia dilworthii]|uniref:Uncharacterized protein n=1 Tax=Paraburkholderia dilworthii TaxID=948106 RepID=A0ABW9DB00_9BURK